MAETAPETPTSVGHIVSDAFRELGSTAVAFIKAPKALWGINIPYVIEGLVYFGILTILGKYCSENVSLSDIHAGWVYSAVTAGITLAMLFLGGVSDKIGVRQALALAFCMSSGAVWSRSPGPSRSDRVWVRRCSSSWRWGC
jgi:MFS family permease